MTIIEQIKAEIEKLIKRYGSVKAKGILQEGYKGGRLIGYEDVLNILKRIQEGLEKPMNQDGLDENIKHYIEDCGWEKDSTIPVSFVRQIASHFYDLGCRRTAEKYDEIEYNRQRAEEQGSEGLEEEIKRYLHSLGVGYGGWVDGMDDDDLRGIARHFAQWGAEHFRDPTKMISGSSEIPKDLEEASSKFATHIASNGVSVEFLEEKLSFQEGAKWQKEQDDKELSEKIVAAYQLGLADKEKQMLNEAVEGFVNYYEDSGGILMAEAQVGCPYHNGDKVKIIIINE